jgi:hypothetical protein
MYTIDLILKYSPIPVSVQRKEKEAAQAVYDQVKSLMSSQPPQLVELTCEKQPDKTLAVLSDQISAVVVSQKAAMASGRTPGFLATSEGA